MQELRNRPPKKSDFVIFSGVARILKLPGHRNCRLLKAAHRGV